MTLPIGSDEITPENLTALFHEHRIIRGSHRFPNNVAMQDLAATMELLRLLRRPEDLRASAQDLLKNAFKSLYGAIENLNEAATFCLRNSENLPDTFGFLASKQYFDTTARDLLNALNWAATSWDASVEGPPLLHRWHNAAPTIEHAFREAVKTTNPDLELKVSNDGPIVRFCAAIIPWITGEEPTPTAVARHLQRLDAPPRRKDV